MCTLLGLVTRSCVCAVPTPVRGSNGFSELRKSSSSAHCSCRYMIRLEIGDGRKLVKVVSLAVALFTRLTTRLIRRAFPSCLSPAESGKSKIYYTC